MYNIKAPFTADIEDNKIKIFLGGSIEMGSAKDWQTEISEKLAFRSGYLFNPRRSDWDKSWIQDPSYDTQFNKQVSWELKYQNLSDILIYNFEPGTISPITLLELGLYLKTSKQKFVICPKEFQRYGNVKLTCELEGVNTKFYESRNEEFYTDLNLAIQRFYHETTL